MASIRVISGVGVKGPACFLLETAGKRILIDLGIGPDVGAVPEVEDAEPLDALVLSHAHPDHAGGLHLLRKVPRVYGTALTLDLLGIRDGVALPVRPTASVLGVGVQCGRAGHAPGGVWLRFDVGGGFLYMGDSCSESAVYAYDPPPQAETVIFDASYGLHDGRNSLADPPWSSELSPESLEESALILPVPAEGRALEFVWLLAGNARQQLRVDDAVRRSIRSTLTSGTEYLRKGVGSTLIGLVDDLEAVSVEHPRGLNIVADGEAGTGTARDLVRRWAAHARGPRFLFTGYRGAGTAAERLVAEGRACWSRWNVHPLFSDNAALLALPGVRRAIPAFCSARDLSDLAGALPHIRPGANGETLLL